MTEIQQEVLWNKKAFQIKLYPISYPLFLTPGAMSVFYKGKLGKIDLCHNPQVGFKWSVSIECYYTECMDGDHYITETGESAQEALDNLRDKLENLIKNVNDVLNY